MSRHLVGAASVSATLLLAPLPASAQGQPSPVPLAQQERTAAMADDMGSAGPRLWLDQAEAALQRSGWARASELLERAETRLLSRSRPVTDGNQPIQDPAVARIAAAREAIMRRDSAAALVEIAQARTVLGTWQQGHDGMAGAMSQAPGVMVPRGAGPQAMQPAPGLAPEPMPREGRALQPPR